MNIFEVIIGGIIGGAIVFVFLALWYKYKKGE